jgi:hypothetical protein
MRSVINRFAQSRSDLLHKTSFDTNVNPPHAAVFADAQNAATGLQHDVNVSVDMDRNTEASDKKRRKAAKWSHPM